MRLLKFIWWFLIASFCGLALCLSGAFLYLAPNLPSVESLRQVQLQIPLRIYSNDNKLIAEFGEMRRSPVQFNEIPEDFISALLTAEDDNFANHFGIDFTSLLRALTELLGTGRIQTGGSTITMQVAKNYFLSSERSFSRKFNEILLAIQIERELSKQEILELYVNKIYLGNRAYGIEAAAQVYYGKSINELTLSQMAVIAALPKAPSQINPLVNPARAKERRDWILNRLYRLGRIDQVRYDVALAEPIDASYHVPTPELNAPYIAEMARSEMVGRYGSAAYTEGFKVVTTVTSDVQNAATTAIHEGLFRYDQRHGYRGPEKQLASLPREQWRSALAQLGSPGGLEPAAVTAVVNSGIQTLLANGEESTIAWDSMKWARSHLSNDRLGNAPQKPADVVKVGDVIRVQRQADQSLRFVQIPAAQSALVSLRPHDGAILALVGGFSFEQSNYNRAAQAKRLTGSSFKPFIYSAALDQKYTAATLINDAPIVFEDSQSWRPRNDSNTFLGPIRLREALYRSRNLVSIRLLQDLGIDSTVRYIERFGFAPQDLPRDLSLALGTAGLTPLEVATGWAAFANGGYKIQPYLIEQIEDRHGKVLFTANPARVPQQAAARSGTSTENVPDTESEQPIAEQIIDPRTAYIMTSILQDVIKRGTGRRALALGRNDLAGKTGTTNESKDSWFSGYNADYVTTVWAGFDQPITLGRYEYGSTVALPIWIDFMGTVLQGKPEHLPAEPKGLVRLRVDPVTGYSVPPGTPGAYFELFKSELTPPLIDEFASPGLTDGDLPPTPIAPETPIDLF